MSDRRRRRCALDARGRACERPRRRALRLRPRRSRERLLGALADHGVTGVLLVGGASRRFGSPKALATIGGETLAERAHRTLAAAFDEVIAVGKNGDALPLPFPILDDGSDERAALVGLRAGLRRVETPVAVVLPTDMPLVTAGMLGALADALMVGEHAAATFARGPLPAAIRRDALPVVERRVAARAYELRALFRELEAAVVPADDAALANVNTPDDAAALARLLPAR